MNKSEVDADKFRHALDQELAKLEGLAMGLEQRGEKSAAQLVRWAKNLKATSFVDRRGAVIERLETRVAELEKAALELFPYSEKLAALRAENERLREALNLAVSRGCDHCAESIRQARALAAAGHTQGSGGEDITELAEELQRRCEDACRVASKITKLEEDWMRVGYGGKPK